MVFLTDIIILSEKVFDELFDNKDISKKELFDTYRALENLLEKINLVSTHNLLIEDEMLKNVFGMTHVRYRNFLNRHLTELHKSLIVYLLCLDSLYYETKGDVYYLIEKYYDSKYFQNIVSKEYYKKPILEEDFKTLSYTYIKMQDIKTSAFLRRTKINIETFNEKIEFKKELFLVVESLSLHKEKIKEYILKNISIEEVL